MASFIETSSARRAGALVRTCVLGACLLLPGGAGAEPAKAPEVEPTGEVREFHLTAEPAQWEIAPGVVVDAWTYNGQVPGPELRVREGDLVRVVVANRLPVPTTVHWHGVDVPFAMDGVPGLTQAPIMPGETFVYEFPATNPGTRWYHTHQDSNAQLELGLYGTLIIEHRDDPNGAFDREFTYVFDEKALDFTPQVALGTAQLRNVAAGNGRGGLPQFDLFLINGKAGQAIPVNEVREGERVRLRLINVGHLVHSIHLHGHSMRIIATDGNPIPPAGQWLKDTITIGPSERFDVEVLTTNPGLWMLHCHMPNHQDNGMMTLLAYEGVAPIVEDGHEHGGPPVPPLETQPPAALTTAPALPPAAPAQTGPGGAGFEVGVVDNRFETRTLSVPVGATVTWRSKGINLHTTTSVDGLWDSGVLPPGATFSYTFSRPGTYHYFCRQHALQGQFATVVVQ